MVPGALSTATPPAGWQRILNGERFTDPTANAGLVASAARPGRLAGCALPAGAGRQGVPFFVMSDDAGHTWQTREISTGQQAERCTIQADAQQPDTFAVELGGDSSNFWVTTDAGRAWRAISAPTGYVIQGAPGSISLVSGHLIMIIHRLSQQEWHLAEVSLDGTWHLLDKALPGIHSVGAATETYPPQAYAMDPANPAHIYATVSLGARGITLYVTHDTGASWQAIRQWPTVEHMALWTARDHKLYVQDLQDQDAALPTQFFYSPNDGISWKDCSLHLRQGEMVFIGPEGRVVTYVGESATAGHFFTLDSTTGAFSPLATAALGPGAFRGVVVEGAQPLFLYASTENTYSLALPAR